MPDPAGPSPKQEFQFIIAPVALPEGKIIGLIGGSLGQTLHPMASGSYGFVKILDGRWDEGAILPPTLREG